MRRAPWPAALGFGVALAVLILLVGPLLLFNPWFVSLLQERHDVAATIGATPDQVATVTEALLADIYAFGSFEASINGVPLLDARERSHMQDVSRLVRLLWLVAGVAVAFVVVAALAMWGERRRIGGLMLAAAGGIGAAAIVLAIIFAAAFEPAFLAFHAIFFPAGTYLFAPGSRLITLFPGGFWFDASLAAGAAIVLSALVVLGLGWWLRRSARA